MELYAQPTVYLPIGEQCPRGDVQSRLLLCGVTPASTLFGNYFVETLKWNGLLVTIINMLANFVTEYLFDRFFVFGNSIDTNDIAQKKREEQGA